jgi:hypothetical protein
VRRTACILIVAACGVASADPGLWAESAAIVRVDHEHPPNAEGPCVLRGRIWDKEQHQFSGIGAPLVEARSLTIIGSQVFEGVGVAAVVEPDGRYSLVLTTRFPIRLTVRRFGYQSTYVDVGACGVTVNFDLSSNFSHTQKNTDQRALAIVSGSVMGDPFATAACVVRGRAWRLDHRGLRPAQAAKFVRYVVLLDFGDLVTSDADILEDVDPSGNASFEFPAFPGRGATASLVSAGDDDGGAFVLAGSCGVNVDFVLLGPGDSLAP